jgi:hypothetical protein
MTRTNMKTTSAPSALGVTLLLLATACGGAGAPPKSAAEAPAPSPGGQAGYPLAPSAGASLPSAAPSQASPEPSADSATKMPLSPTTAPPRSSLRRDVEAAQRELETAGSDCTAACRALGSMERATARLCSLEESGCEDVRVRLRRARDRVRASCGRCADGTSVDPDAPIPSR